MTIATIYPSLNDETVLITGGATGIGAAMVAAFAGQGAAVGFVDIDAESARHLQDQVEQDTGRRPWFCSVDVTDIEALRAALREAIESLGPPLALVNNVANDTRIPPAELSESRWRDCMAVNLDAAFFATQTAFDSMRDRGRGSVINLSSINALLGPPDMPGYVTAKAGLIGMTKALASDYGASGIRVNAILPGWVVTDRQLDTWLTPEAEAEWMQHVALRRRLLPEDVAGLALFLAADDSAMITGQSLTIDAGRT